MIHRLKILLPYVSYVYQRYKILMHWRYISCHGPCVWMMCANTCTFIVHIFVYQYMLCVWMLYVWLTIVINPQTLWNISSCVLWFDSIIKRCHFCHSFTNFPGSNICISIIHFTIICFVLLKYFMTHTVYWKFGKPFFER